MGGAVPPRLGEGNILTSFAAVLPSSSTAGFLTIAAVVAAFLFPAPHRRCKSTR